MIFKEEGTASKFFCHGCRVDLKNYLKKLKQLKSNLGASTTN